MDEHRQGVATNGARAESRSEQGWGKDPVAPAMYLVAECGQLCTGTTCQTPFNADLVAKLLGNLLMTIMFIANMWVSPWNNTSPPYERARKYDELNFSLRGLAWAAWCADRFEACLRVSRGLVAWVVGHGSSGAVAPWSAAPALLIAELHSRGVHLLRPCWYRRHGIPGAGGKQWFSPKIEWIVCATSAPNGRLPYAQVTAELGHAPKGPPVGPMSCRLRDGSRCVQRYKPPKRSNPGDVFDIGAVGGGRIGNGLAHENEAPFPEALAEPFVRAFCPPGGVVLDPFCGSGTTLAVALRHGRRAVGIDARQSQIELSRLRCRSEFTLFHSEIER